jgi:hypothetical protein
MIINMKTEQGNKLYKSATKGLFDTKFNCETEGLRKMLVALDNRATEYGWTETILQIPKQGERRMYNLINEYGMITMTDIKAHIDSYRYTRTRAAQDSVMMHQCIINSITMVLIKGTVTRICGYPVYLLDDVK